MSLAIFIASFVFSVAQAFADGGDSYPVLTLTSALYGWLPMLVIFMIVDGNPNSCERSAELLSRWLYNADAVRTWAPDREKLEGGPHMYRPGVARWPSNAVEAQSPHTGWCHVGDFVGHGRSMHYCGLVSAFMEAAEKMDWVTDPNFICNLTKALLLKEKRPRSWYITAFVSLFLVWTEIFLAVVVDYYTPTLGFGCWSGATVLYALLGMVSWLIQFKRRLGKILMAIAHVFNTLAILWILAATFMVVTGATDTCYCNTCMLNRQLGFSQFEAIMDFETFEFGRDNFSVAWIWALCASIGGLLPIAVFTVALFWWLRCRDLWSVDERSGPSIRYMSLAWLQ
ncbi:hypothetical protein G7Y89_g11394 [Cudoniella acicularis]|uniref:Uncharacterized protein n=1 Tax=Cudoniella acicularis TaxID=354080 RepID=A0A8H4RDS0_9HELO|nr:hypothetical protein G7Y89_g11394 [Cudoniella acicularis]